MPATIVDSAGGEEGRLLKERLGLEARNGVTLAVSHAMAPAPTAW